MDLKQQKAETEQIFREIAKMEALPAEARIAFQFVDEIGRGDWDGFIEAAEAEGYEAAWFEAEDDEEEDCLEITSPLVKLTVATLWAHEEKLTLMGSLYGFIPDGWGFVGA